MSKPRAMAGRHDGRWHGIAYWAVLLALCAVFMAMNLLTTMKEDDLAFSLVEGEWTPIGSLADALRSHANHFMHANGRTANLLAAIFCGITGKGVFNVLNAVVFGVMAHLMALLSAGRRSILAVTVFAAVTGTCFPVPGETMLWLDGSCNYMWAITMSLALTWYLSKERTARLGWGRGVLLGLAAAVAGSMNEATSFGWFAGLCLYYAFNRRRLDRRALVALAGYLVGIIIIIASPGAWDRAASGGIVTDLGAGDLLASRWHIFADKMWRFYLPVIAVAAGVVAWRAWGWKTLRTAPWTYLFACLALTLFALGIIHERAYAALVTAALIVITAVMERLLDGRWRRARMAAIAVCLVLAAFTWARGVDALKRYKAFDAQAVAEIKAAPAQAILQARRFDGYSRFVKPMNYDSGDYFAHEVIYRAYYGKQNVQFAGDSVYHRFHGGHLLDNAYLLPLASDRPDVVGAVLGFRGQDYMAAVLLTDTLPCTFQTARYVLAQSGLDAGERARRARYGLEEEYTPRGCYPLEYQGRKLFICPLIDDATDRIVLPLDLWGGEVTLTRKP